MMTLLQNIQQKAHPYLNAKLLPSMEVNQFLENIKKFRSLMK